MSSREASYIIDVVVDGLDIPFLLDNKGYVWAFKKPLSREDPVRLPNLKGIKKIAPWIALDKNGNVFTWSLDKRTDMPTPDEMDAVYTTPQRVEGLSNISMIAYNVGRFVAVREDRDILEWSRILSNDGFGLKGYTPLKKLHTQIGIKEMAITSRSTLVLFRDGTILGWGLNEFGQTKKGLSDQQVAFKVPDIESVYLNYEHMILLLKNGHTLFWGGCNSGDTVGSSGILPSDGIVSGASGQVADVMTMATPGNDNTNPNIFLKRDGTLWRAYAPLPPGFKNRKLGCGIVRCPEQENFATLLGRDIALQRRGINTFATAPILCPVEKSWQLIGMTVPAIAVRANRHSVLVLGADHTL